MNREQRHGLIDRLRERGVLRVAARLTTARARFFLILLGQAFIAPVGGGVKATRQWHAATPAPGIC